MKKILTIITILICMCTSIVPIKASDLNDNYEDSLINTNTSIIQRTGNHTVLTKISSGSKQYVNCGYHPDTSIWRRVSSYNFNTSTTVSISVSFSYGGEAYSGTVGISKTASQSFGYTISADQSRPSKLRVYLDFNWTYYRADVIDNTSGAVVNTYYFTSIQKTGEYFVPVYQ